MLLVLLLFSTLVPLARCQRPSAVIGSSSSSSSSSSSGGGGGGGSGGAVVASGQQRQLVEVTARGRAVAAAPPLGGAQPRDGALIVTLLDGSIVAVDRDRGRVLWTFDSGAPLVSARQSPAGRRGFNVFPGADGGLYAYHGGGGGGGGGDAQRGLSLEVCVCVCVCDAAASHLDAASVRRCVRLPCPAALPSPFFLDDLWL